MERTDKDYLKLVYGEAREVIGSTDNAQKSEAKTIDKMVQTGCYANSDTDAEEAEMAEKMKEYLLCFYESLREVYYPSDSIPEETTTPEHEDDQVIGKYWTAVRWMAIIVLSQVFLSFFGVSSFWELFVLLVRTAWPG